LSVPWGGNFVAVDEHQASLAESVGKGRHRCQQHRAVSTIEQRETPARQGGSHTAVEHLHHFQERALIDEP
jgi:hypothetical protein